MHNVLFFKDDEMLPHLGGISRINCNLRNALTKHGYNCVFLSSTKSENIIADKCQRWLPDLGMTYSEVNMRWLHRYIEDNKIKVIINNSFDSLSVRLLDEARRGTECILISWIHNNIVEYGSLVAYRYEKQLKDKFLYFLYVIATCGMIVRTLRYFSKCKHTSTAQEIYNRSDKILTVCDGNIKEFLFLLGKKDIKRKVLSIPNFVPQLGNEVCEEEKTKSVVWCGSVDYDLKKTNWMLQIWRSIQSTHPDWTLTIIGDGKQLESMKQYAEEIGVERVLFTGRVNPESYYRKASVLCSTSISESFGLTLVEGMQYGVVPVAFASSAAIREIVGYNGCLVKPYNKRKFVSELSNIMENDTYRRFMAEKCRIASMRYSEAMIVKIWQKLFEFIDKKQ